MPLIKPKSAKDAIRTLAGVFSVFEPNQPVPDKFECLKFLAHIGAHVAPTEVNCHEKYNQQLGRVLTGLITNFKQAKHSEQPRNVTPIKAQVLKLNSANADKFN